MALHKSCEVVGGPGTWELMLGLFDFLAGVTSDMDSPRYPEFKALGAQGKTAFKTPIIGVENPHGSYWRARFKDQTSWLIKGTVVDSVFPYLFDDCQGDDDDYDLYDEIPVIITYDSQTRKGKVTIANAFWRQLQANLKESKRQARQSAPVDGTPDNG